MNGVLFESILRAADPQNGFHTAKTRSGHSTRLVQIVARPVPDELLRVATGGDRTGDPFQTAALPIESSLDIEGLTGRSVKSASRQRANNAEADRQQAKQDQPGPKKRLAFAV